jgi:hypothetical protein
VARYLLVDDRDGGVLAEFASAAQAMALLRQAMGLLSRLERTPQGAPPLSLVRLDHQQGSRTEVFSMVSMRPLAPLMARRTGLGPDQDIA